MGKISEALEKASRENNSKLQKRGPAPDPIAMPKEPATVSTKIETAPLEKKAAAQAENTLEVEKPSPKVNPLLPEGNNADPGRQDKPGVVIHRDKPLHVVEHKDIVVDDKTPKPGEAAKPLGSAAQKQSPAGKPSAHLAGNRISHRSDIQINYSRTKVQSSDLEMLKNNKIFSLFDDIETTDQIKILRTRLLKKLDDIGGNSILVTSANPYEGKTFTSINLGVSIAKEFNRTVLIIDADLRKPTKRHTAFSTEFFSLDVEFGLTEYLRGDAEIPDILINPGINKLTLIPSGKPADNAPELLSSDRMQEMMAEIKSRYPSDRLVIVDGPAVLPFPDALILSRYVDGVVPVVEIEKTPADQVKEMMEILKEARILGTVMNKNKG